MMKTKKLVVTTFRQVQQQYEYIVEVPENFNEDEHSLSIDDHELLWEQIYDSQGKEVDSYDDGEEISHCKLLENS